MGCTVREKHMRTNRRTRSSKSDTNRFYKCQVGCNESGQNSNLEFDDSNWGYCSEEQLEELLLNHLEYLYSEARSRLVALGYDENVALKAILKNGHCYGGMDVLTNILHNCLSYLNNGNSEEAGPDFVDMRHLEEYSLASMVSLLQQVKPHLSTGDAMWCLLMSNLHVGQASVMNIPLHPSHSIDDGCRSGPALNIVEDAGKDHPIGVAPALCRFHGGWGYGTGGTSEFPMNDYFPYSLEMTLQREIECPKRFNLTPSMRNLLKRNVAAFAAGFRANSKEIHTQANGCSDSLSTGNAFTGFKSGTETPVEQCEELQGIKGKDVVGSMLDKFHGLNLDENIEFVADDQKDEMILSMLHQIKDLERQVKERKEWAHQKAMQAARKLSHDLTELKMLRMERNETLRLKEEKPTLDDSTKKRLSEVEDALKIASGKLDNANKAVRDLETANAEIRAEMEASKLSASESLTTSFEVAKREKKNLKRLLAREKQKTTLEDDIAAEKQQISQLEAHLMRVQAAEKEAEAKWKHAQKAKESAWAQVEEERRLKETLEVSNKRGHEALRHKIRIDFQRLKDDLQRLEQELSRLKVSAQATEPNSQRNNLQALTKERKPQGETIVSMLNALDNQESSEKGDSDRECCICQNEEVSVVFLPCAHEVMCSNCSEKNRRAECPCCGVPIEQQIRVFGAS